jgi:hypothetical protein
MGGREYKRALAIGGRYNANNHLSCDQLRNSLGGFASGSGNQGARESSAGLLGD